MNCYQCAEKEKCPLRTDPDMRKLFRCKYAEDAEDEQQAEIERVKAEKTKEFDYLLSKFEEGKKIETVKTMDEEELKKEHAGKPAQINYLPVCSECGKIIQDEVKLIKLRTGMSRDYGINPECCPFCGAVFNGITEWRTVIEEAKE